MQADALRSGGRRYHGVLTPAGPRVEVEDQERVATCPTSIVTPRRVRVRLRGGGADGPGRSLLTDVYGPGQEVDRHYRDFAAENIAHLPRRASWTLDEREVRDTISQLEHAPEQQRAHDPDVDSARSSTLCHSRVIG